MNPELAPLIVTPLTFFGLLLLEWLFPARPLFRIAAGRGKGALFFLLVSALLIIVPLLRRDFISRWRLRNLEVRVYRGRGERLCT